MDFHQNILENFKSNQYKKVHELLIGPILTSIPSALCLEYIKTITFILIHAVEKRYCTDNLSAECEIHLENIIIECLRFLRSCCPKGETFQNHIVTSKQEEESNSFFRAVNTILNDDVGNQSPHKLSARTRKMCWQLVANLIVQNSLTQQLVWQHCKQNLYMCLNQNIYDNFRECTMILYNIFIGGAIDDYSVEILELLLIHVHSSNHLLQNDFYHIFLEHFINEHRRFVPIYAKIEPTKRLMLLHYIADHMKDKIQKPIQTSLLQYICKEFKKKSDCVLKTVSSFVDRIEPKEVVAMLDVIVQASSDERYFHVLNNDSSLFLNVGCLLSAIVMTGKQANQGDGNIFAPVQTLGQIAPNSTEENSIERDISYELKTMLVRVVGNLAYKNKTNQNLAREMDILMAVLDSTNLDARNPLIKEWSILAIRNLCENNTENQQIVRQLTKVGDANSDILKELNLEMGSLRINP